MRPLSLEFQAFGPYAGRERIDFETLTEKGLLLICGDTGSGKTMILDAMTLALYGKASGGMRNEFSSLRCNRCDPDADTFIEFVFEASGSIYKFERRLEKKRINLSEKQNVYRMDEEGRFEPLRGKINKSDLPGIAKELIGLDYEQFTQVIILPQGKFEQFLESDSGQKGEILTEIFGAGRWEAAARRYYDSVKADYDKLIAVKDKVGSILESEGCEDLDGLRQKIDDTDRELEDLDRRFEEADFDARQKRLLADKEIAGKLNALRKALTGRQTEAKTADRKAEQREADLEKAENRLKDHKNRASDKDIWNKEKSALESKRELYINAEKVREDYGSAEALWRNACERTTVAEKNLERAEKKEADALKAYEEADRQHKAVLEAFARGAAGRLAADLKEGEACPVCGSTHHPSPAQTAADTVSSAQVDEKFEALGKRHADWEKARKKTQEVRDMAAKAREDRAELGSRKDAAEKALHASKAGMIDGIVSLSELDQRIARIDQETAAYDRKLTELSEDAEKCRISLAEARTAQEKAAEETVKAAEELNIALESLRKSGTEEPDTAQIDQELKTIERDREAFQRQHGSLSAGIERLNGMFSNLTEEWNSYSEQIADAEDALGFARQLRGDASIGLKRYVLGIMFDQVVYAANEMLSKVHGGRYSLVRTEESMTGSRKKGLELAVMDSFSDSDGLRPAGSLSGGEKFLVSLALSIGMSTIARTDGINIDAMFIDEGFGSLDENSIGDALEVLESIRGGGDSFVGIISHVQILRDSIPSKLIVHKSRKTSTLEYTLG